jgi:hypothetical protein
MKHGAYEPADRSGSENSDSHPLDHDVVIWKQFCFSGGEAIRQEKREVRTGGTGERFDEAGARRPETRRAG